MKKLIVIVLMLSSCTPTLMFGGRVIGPYVKHFHGQMKCAFVEGWFTKKKCMCYITDQNFSPDRTFLAAEYVMCEKSF